MKKKNVFSVLMITTFFSLLFITGFLTLKASKIQILSIIKLNFIDKYEEKKFAKFSKFSPEFEEILTSFIVGRRFWIDLNGITWKLEAKLAVDSGAIYKDMKGNLHTITRTKIDSKEILKLAFLYSRASTFCDSRSIPFFFLQAPSKVLPGITKFPCGTLDYSNANADALLAMMSEFNIKTLDLRMEMIDKNAEQNGLFYITDHHWTTKTALRAAYLIASAGNTLLPDCLKIGLPQPEKFKTLIWEKRFLGSQGVRTGKFFAGIDNFEIMAPEEAIQFSYWKIDKEKKELYKGGDFLDALINIPLLNSDYVNVYNAFLYGADHEARIINHKNPDGAKVLLISDSFGRSVAPYLALGLSEIVYLDPQKGRYQGNIKEYIQIFDPDIVIAMFTAVLPAATFDFF